MPKTTVSKTTVSKPFPDDILLWEQQRRESAQAYQAFAVYRDMGQERSVRAVVQRLHKSLTLIGKWSSSYDWVERVRAYDADRDRVRRRAAEKEHERELKAYRERAKTVSEHFGTLGMAGAKIAAVRLMALSEEKIEKMSVKEIVMLMRASQLVMDTSLNAEAEAIGVREIENLLSDNMVSDDRDG